MQHAFTHVLRVVPNAEEFHRVTWIRRKDHITILVGPCTLRIETGFMTEIA